MLQVIDICKEYRTGSLVQQALDHVSLTLRDNEFVAILGPSGSGKTTLLNVIGGLDRYDSGDLQINGISTKRYHDRDWDSYRNHTIGFVFQSYNLIPHQNILSNVELALTIGGISKAERKQRAIQALEEVGLKEHIYKKPNQLSGGQMQRVAIARALVNNPDILLADEPTGALDSNTSVQVMELLKEVAKDRLVVMVTHNPELAEQYATRIVRLKDGHIIDDTDPVQQVTTPAFHQNMGKSSMSYLTALSLSFNNLRTKLARTLLVSAAGSIGIIGIALIMSLSNGVNRYIQDIEEETLLEYPLEILNNSISLSSFIEVPDENRETIEADVVERRVVANMFSRVSSNDLGSLRSYFESGESGIYDYVKTIEYRYNVTPYIYRLEKEEVRQVNPDQSFASLGFGASNSFFMASFNTDVFNALPKDMTLYEDSYEVRAGRWPRNEYECILVVSQSGRISDLLLYTLGLKDSSELDDMMETFASGEEVKELTSPLQRYQFEDFLGINFKRINQADLYQYDSTYNVWTDKSDDKKFMRNLVETGDDLTIVGVVQPKEDASVTMLIPGIYYPEALTQHVIAQSKSYEITRNQLSDSTIDVFTGKGFREDSDDPALDLGSLFSVDPVAMSRVFSFDASKMSVDPSIFSNMDFSSMMQSSSMPSSMDFSTILKDVNVKVNNENLMKLFQDVLEGYEDYKGDDPTIDYENLGPSIQDYLATPEGQQLLQQELQRLIADSGLAQLNSDDIQNAVTNIMSGYPQFVLGNGLDPTDFQNNLVLYLQSDVGQALIQQTVLDFAQIVGDTPITTGQLQTLITNLDQGYEEYASENDLPSPDKIIASFQQYLQSEEGSQVILNGIQTSVNTEEIEKQISKNMAESFSGLEDGITNMMSAMMSQISTKITDAMTTAMSQVANNLNSAFSIHPEEFANAISMNMTETELSELMTSLMSKQPSSYEGNLRLLGYADTKKPYSIIIYPRDFESKQEVIRILDDYNERMSKEDEDKVITYTDTVGLLMSSVTDIINAISYMLIAFVAISLVVSSIMIGVITYISVLERQKEIGILRAIGASKKNISSVFNAETFIIGFLAGVIGILMTLVLLIPGNMLIRHFTSANIRARLPIQGGIALIILSTILTMIGGILPSRKAAKSDPVTALRTE